MTDMSGGPGPPLTNSELETTKLWLQGMELVNSTPFQYEKVVATGACNDIVMFHPENTALSLLPQKRPSKLENQMEKKKKNDDQVFNPGDVQVNDLFQNDQTYVIEKQVGNTPTVDKNSDQNISQIQTSANNNNSENVNTNASYYEKYKNNRFSQLDKGPFFVILESSLQNGNIGKLHRMSTGKLIYKILNSTEIEDIFSIGRNRIKILTKTAVAAHKIIESVLLKEQNLIAYIPDSILYRKGVIRNVDLNLTDDEILSEIKSNIKICSIKRMTRRVAPGQYSHTSSVALTFRGQELPEFVSIYGAKCQVKPYIYRVTQCLRCLRFAHIGRQCKGQARCSKCSENHPSDQCSDSSKFVKCANCNGPHRATDFSCPIYQEQKLIKIYMAFNNTDYHTARKNYKKYSEAVITPSSYAKDFPPLEISNRYHSLQNSSSTTPDSSDDILPLSHFTPNFKLRSFKTNQKNQQPTSNYEASTSKQLYTPLIRRNPYPPRYQTNSNSNSGDNNHSSSIITAHNYENKITQICQQILEMMSEARTGNPSTLLQLKQRILDSLQTSS